MTGLPRPTARGCRGAAATGHPLATDAAMRVFADGGTAVDAAVAAAYALSVVLPESCGLGGDALLTVRDGDGTHVSFNGSGCAPRGFTGSVPDDGARTATVPGIVAALDEAHQRYGRAERADVLAPAIRLATKGFPAQHSLVEACDRQRSRLQRGAPDWPAPNTAGELLLQPALGGLIERISAVGPSAFYSGEMADAIAAACARESAQMSKDDLAEHTTIIRAPLSARFRGHTVIAQPPVTQAILALMALQPLDQLASSDAFDRVHTAVEAMEGAFAYADEVVADCAEDRLLGADLGIDPQRAQRRGGPTVQTHTTAVATSDSDGQVVTMVISVFDEFGCASLVPEGGFFLNNRMMGFSKDPSSPNAVAPGRRPRHTLAPLMLEGPNEILALATPGADGQVQTLTQLIDSLVTDGLAHTQALDRRRWRSTDGELSLEQGFDTAVADRLIAAGHSVNWKPAGARPFGAAVFAGFDSVNECAFAAADLRRDAWAAAC